MASPFSTEPITEDKKIDPGMPADSQLPSYSHSSINKADSLNLEEEIEPTEEEFATLRHIGDKIPLSAWLVAIVELAERFTYYGLTGPFQNYIQNRRDDPLHPGALGKGQATASSLQYFFQFWCYVTPIFGAIVADAWLGRYNAICLFSGIYVVGLAILVGTSFPASLEAGAGYAGIIVTMIVLGLGTGGIKANVSPLIAEQYTRIKPRISVHKTGERVIIDPAVTIQSLYNIFYWSINIGSLSAIATVWMELKIDFWAAYLLPFCFFFVGIAVLFAGRNKYVIRPPSGSVILDAGKAFVMAARNNFNMDSVRTRFGDQFVDELKRALVACRVFLFYPAFWLLYGQMNTSFVSMAATMELHGIPNDLLFNINPIAIIIFIPIMEKWVYPGLRKRHIAFRPITRIALGFFLIAGSMAYAAGIQRYIYNQGPCYEFPLTCDASEDGNIPNRAHVALQTPAYVLVALGEIFASVTGLEYAFTKAPPSMKSIVTSVFLLQNAFGSAIGIGVVRTAKNPHMVTFFACLAGVTFVVGCVFWVLFKKHNQTEDEMNRLDAKNEEFRVRPTTEVVTAMGKIKEKVHHHHDGHEQV